MLNEYPFVFINSQFTLQSIASNEVALNLWRHRYFNRPPAPKLNDTEFWFQKEKLSCDEFLLVPPRIKTTINEKIESIRWQLDLWIMILSKAALFGENFPVVFPNCFHSIVLSPNGTISLKETASNLVRGNLFSNVEKYKIACYFCVEDDVKQIWPLVSKNPLVVGESAQVKSNLMFHWNCRMISKKDPVTAIGRFQKSFQARNYEALEYFFDMLPYQNKITKARTVIGSHDDDLMFRLLRKLNADQARKVFQARGWEILSVLIRRQEYYCYLHDLWTAVKDGLFENSPKFLDILRGLWMAVFNEYGPDSDRDQINSLLIEVWTSAPINLKSSIADHLFRMQYFFSKLSLKSWAFSRIYGHDMSFMLQLFDLANYEIRNQLWKNHWRKLAVRAKPSQLEKFIELSLPDGEAVEKFKRDSILKFTALYQLFIKTGRYSDFSEYLRLFCNDPKRIRDLSKRALKSNVDLIILADNDNFSEFETFVGEIFSNSAAEMKKFKKEMIFSKKAMKCLNGAFDKNTMENFVKIIGLFIFSKKSLSNFKKKFLEIRRNNFTSDWPPVFDHDKWVKLLEWCFADVQQIAAFKTSLNIDAVFQKQITNYARRKVGLDFFQKFAKWYFGDEKAVKRFKVNRNLVIFQFPEVNNLFMSENGVRQFDVLVQWLFENDEVQLRTFLNTRFLHDY